MNAADDGSGAALASAGRTPPLALLDAAQALRFRAGPESFDAVVTDERMPGMSGSALIREVRRIPRGADEILEKPLSVRDLAMSLARPAAQSAGSPTGALAGPPPDGPAGRRLPNPPRGAFP